MERRAEDEFDLSPDMRVECGSARGGMDAAHGEVQAGHMTTGNNVSTRVERTPYMCVRNYVESVNTSLSLILIVLHKQKYGVHTKNAHERVWLNNLILKVEKAEIIL